MQLQLPTSRKLGVGAVFLLGALTVLAGIGKLVVVYKVFASKSVGVFLLLVSSLNTQVLSNPTIVDITYLETPLVYWTMVESSLGVIGACLPQMTPVAKAVYRGLKRHLQSLYPRAGKEPSATTV